MSEDIGEYERRLATPRTTGLLDRRNLLASVGAGLAVSVPPLDRLLAEELPPPGATKTMPFDSTFGARGDASTDNVGAFMAFRKAALALNRAEPRTIIQLDLTPGATYCCGNPYILAGINNLLVNGRKAALQSTAVGANNDFLLWWCGGFGYVDSLEGARAAVGFSINQTAYRIQTANEGANAVRCMEAGQAAMMAEGQWVLVSSQCSYYGGSPPAMRFFDYALVIATDPKTGLVQLDRKIANTHLASLPARFKSGTFPSAATIFPLGPAFDVRQRYRDVNFLASPHPRDGIQYIIAQGVQVDFEGGSIHGGLTPSQLIRGSCKSVSITGIRDVFEVDKLVGSFSFIQSEISGSISIGQSTGPIEFESCNSAGGIVQPGQNLAIRNSHFSKVSLNGCLQGVFENNGPCAVGLWPVAPNGNHTLVIDGSVVKYADGVISIPYSEIASNYYVWAFICAIWPGAILDITQDFAGFHGSTGGKLVMRSMVDFGDDLHLRVDMHSQTCTSADIVAGGSGYRIGEQIRLTNGVRLLVTTLLETGASKVSIAQNIASQPEGLNVEQVSSSGSGKGAIFNLRFGLPDGAMVTAPTLLSYRARGNANGEPGLVTSDDHADNGTVSGFVNGGNSVRLGNMRSARIAPRSGSSVSYLRQHAAGRIKEISINVVKPYRGTQIPANSLFLRIAEEFPVFGVAEWLVNLSIPGQRIVTAHDAKGIFTGDVIKPVDVYLSAYDVGIVYGGSYPVLTDPDAQLPTIDVSIELEDWRPN